MNNKVPVFFEVTRELQEDEVVQGSDWIEWQRVAWTRVDPDSVFVGKMVSQTQAGIKFRREAG